MSNDFNPTHEFRGLELEYFAIWDSESSWFRDSSHKEYLLPKEAVSKIRRVPQSGEVWKLLSNFNVSPLRGVDTLGRLFTMTHQTVVWDPDVDSSESLDEYIKVLNADGTPA